MRVATKTFAGHDKAATCCCWSRTHRLAVSGSDDKTVRLWSPFSPRAVDCMPGHAAPIVALAVDEEDGLVISLSSDKAIKVGD